MLSIEKPSRYIAPKVAMSEIGTATSGSAVAPRRPQEEEDDEDDEPDREQQGELDVVDRRADRGRAVVEHADRRPRARARRRTAAASP